jgi:hypothetical protein
MGSSPIVGYLPRSPKAQNRVAGYCCEEKTYSRRCTGITEMGKEKFKDVFEKVLFSKYIILLGNINGSEVFKTG